MIVLRSLHSIVPLTVGKRLEIPSQFRSNVLPVEELDRSFIDLPDAAFDFS